jgi:LPXTG-site transpeptidase (sortase) family protein
MDKIKKFNSRGWVKLVVLILLAAAIVFVFLNLSYFGTLISFYFNRTFVTEQQRNEQRDRTEVPMEPDTIYIKSLDIRAPIKYAESNNEDVLQKALRDGVVQYPETAKIGRVGNTYIMGHSSDYAFSKGNYKTVFALLPNIELGAEILIANSEGRVFKYKVYDKFVAKKTDVHLLDQNTNEKRILTLQTSYPIGTALQRYIVKSEYVEEVKSK